MSERLLATDLYAYLIMLAALLDKAGKVDWAHRAIWVSRFGVGSTSELYGEAQAFLSELLRAGAPGLTSAEVSRVNEVLKGIAEEFQRIGGA